MNKIKLLIQSIFYILMYLIITAGTIVIFSFLFQSFSNFSVNNSNYVKLLAHFLNNYRILIVIVSGILLIPLIYKNIKNKSIKFKIIPIKIAISLSVVGISSSLIINSFMLYTGINKPILDNNLSVSFIISTCLLGPILEELVFRGVIYNKLIIAYSKKATIILISLLFGTFHLNFIQGIYAFIFSLIITFVYTKSKNIICPIIIHCFGNLSVSLLLPIIIKLTSLWVFIILLFLFLLDIFLIKFLDKQMSLET